MMTTTKSRTTSIAIRTLPRWLWRLGLAYMIMAFILLMLALPVRYSQLLNAPNNTVGQATLQIFLDYLLVFVTSTVGFMLVFRRSNESIALLASAVMMAGVPNIIGLGVASSQLHPLLYIPNGIIISSVASLAFLLFISLPDGYPYRRWLLWVLVPLLAYDILRYTIFFVLAPPEIQALRPVVVMVTWGFVVVALVAMVHRYRNASSKLQRQQFKWFFLGINVAVFIFVFNQILRAVLVFSGTDTLLVPMFASVLNTFGGILVSVSLVFAILRYGLWDIDLTINRSLVTGIVTIILLVLFGIAFIITQNVLRSILGEAQSEVAVAIAAVVVGVFFNPVRSRVRNFVDRKLYGFRFDLNQLKRHKELAEIANPGALTGRILGGYELLGVVGRGNMGEVYKGIKDDELVAIKILQTAHSQDEAMRQRFAREGKIALDHPNIVKTYGAGEQDGIFYIIMEYVEGLTLKDVLASQGKQSLEDVRDYLSGLAEAIDLAHAQGYVHRDIKPSNLILKMRPDNETFEVVLMDFGIAKILDDTTSLTGSAAVGTIDYMAPEQIRDSTTVDFRADIYALGVVLYETLSGTLPFKGNLAQVLFAHVNQPAPDICHSVPELPWQVADAIDRALQKDPEKRFQSAKEFVLALTATI